MKLWERIVEKRLRSDVKLVHARSLWRSTEKVCVCGPGESLRQGAKRRGVVLHSGLAEKYVRIVQDMYDGSTTAVRCAVGVTEGFDGRIKDRFP